MKRDLIASIVAMLTLTLLLGIAYPLAVTGISQVAFHDKASGSRIERDGKVVGSSLVAQAFDQPVLDENGEPTTDADGVEVREPNIVYFQPRPSQTSYNAAASGFLNQGPNQQELADIFSERLDAYLELEGTYNDGLDKSGVPVDAVANSGSGIDPHISIANARIQAARVAKERGVSRKQVLKLVDGQVDGRWLGVFGTPGVNVLELNLELDKEFPQR